jgi:hypothetical protein
VHGFTAWAETPRDTDGDGIDNTLDVCALSPDGSWNPRINDLLNDPDQDGLPTTCDPFPSQVGGQSPPVCPAGIIGRDEDADCYANLDDNCPTVNQLPSGPGIIIPENPDTDRDDIGDACDPEPLVPNGDKASLCLKFGILVGAPPTPVTGTNDPGPGPGCADPKWGDIDCGGVIDAVDALRVQREVAGLPNEIPKGCAFDGDVDCSAKTDSADALKLLRHRAGLPNPVKDGCPAIGS